MDEDVNETPEMDLAIDDIGTDMTIETGEAPDDFLEDVPVSDEVPDSLDSELALQYDIPNEINEDLVVTSDVLDSNLDSPPEVIPEDIEGLDPEIPDTLYEAPEELTDSIPEDIPDELSVPLDNGAESANEDILEDVESNELPVSEIAEIPGDEIESLYDDIPEDVTTDATAADKADIEDAADNSIPEDDYYHAIPNSERDIQPPTEPYHAIPIAEGTDTSEQVDISSDTDALIDNGQEEIGDVVDPSISEAENEDVGADEDGEMTASQDRLNEKIDEIINNENLSPEQKKDLLTDIRMQLAEVQFGYDLDSEEPLSDMGDESGPILSLKRDESLLLDQGYRNIQDLLEAQADNYRDRGYSDTEISDMLVQDKVAFETEFLRDAFPGQKISPAVFDRFESTDILDGGSGSDIQVLSDVENWLGDINPNFDAFDPESPYCNNCGSCAYAVYQRLEGLSSDSCASAVNIDYNSQMTALTGMEQVSMSPDEIQERLLAEGDGAHAIIGIDRAQGPGHWFNAACIDGKIVAIDGQTGEITDWPPDYGDVVNWEMSVKKGA